MITGELAEKTVGVSPDRSFAAHGGTIELDFYNGMSDENGSTVMVHCQWPEVVDKFVAYTELLKAEDDRTESSWALRIGPRGDLDDFCGIAYRTKLVEALGYQVRSEEFIDDSTIHIWTEFRYPSVRYLNQVLDKISPSEGLRFESYSGGLYTGVDFAEAILRDKALIASEQPYQIHEHAGIHTLGYIGLHGEHLESLKNDIAEPFLARYAHELCAPLVPGIENERMRRFLNPSREVLREFVTAIDEMSGEIANKIFVDAPNYLHNDVPLLRSALEGVYQVQTPERAYCSDRPSIFPLLDIGKIDQYALDIEKRYDRMVTAAGVL